MWVVLTSHPSSRRLPVMGPKEAAKRAEAERKALADAQKIVAIGDVRPMRRLRSWKC